MHAFGNSSTAPGLCRFSIKRSTFSSKALPRNFFWLRARIMYVCKCCYKHIICTSCPYIQLALITCAIQSSAFVLRPVYYMLSMSVTMRKVRVSPFHSWYVASSSNSIFGFFTNFTRAQVMAIHTLLLST